jgi:rRNA maturation endonuclease Nob1
MIRLDITTFIFLYIAISLIGIFIIWLLVGYSSIKRPSSKENKFVWKCSVCFNDYIDSLHEDISVCPLCGSYNKREGKGVAG